MRIALFFGSFNPVHTGHLILADHIAISGLVDKVWFVVSPQSPFKTEKDLAHEHDRYEMVRLAIYDNPRLGLSDVEFHMPKPSFTIDTLLRLSEQFPQHSFSIIMGEDNLGGLPKWKNYKAILEYYPILAYPRKESKVPVPPEIANHPGIQMLDAPQLLVSASFVRTRVKNKQSIAYLVPEPVEAYVEAKKLYS